MLTIVFFKFNDTCDGFTSIDISVSDDVYQKLSEIGLGKLSYEDIDLKIDGEQSQVNVANLRIDNVRNIIKLKLDNIRQQELEMVFKNVNAKSITVKEVRDSFVNVETLTNIYKYLSKEDVHYLSIDA